MDHEKKLKFIHQMTKMGLDSIPHYAAGGAPTDVGGAQREGGFLGIGGADVQKSTNAAQINNAYHQVQDTLGQSGQIASQLGAQTPGAVAAQQGLSRQLQGRAAGQGPNPALNQLNQATGRNVQTQAALMAGQRGAAANPALLARQAAQQGAATQQQAAGEAATLGAQQQVAAQQELAGLSANQVAQAQQAAAAQNTAVQNAQGQILNANNGQNTAIQKAGEMTLPIVGAIGKGVGAITGGLIPGAGPLGAALGKYKGGEVHLAQGGSIIGQYLSEPVAMAEGGEVPAVVSPGEVYLSPEKVKAVLQGADAMKIGQHVPGKAKVKGDSLKNDTVKTQLQEGGVVIPRHIAVHKMAPEKAAAFVHRIAAKKRLHS